MGRKVRTMPGKDEEDKTGGGDKRWNGKEYERRGAEDGTLEGGRRGKRG